jgi:hypothetical protein
VPCSLDEADVGTLPTTKKGLGILPRPFFVSVLIT